MSALGLAKREKSPISTAIPKAVTVETPRRARSLEVTPARSSAPDLSAMAESRRSRRSSHSLTCATYSSTSRSHGSSSSMERSHSRCALVHVDLPLGHTWPFPGRNFDSWWRALISASRASSRARDRSRAASMAGVGGAHSTNSPTASSLERKRASLLSVLTRSPEGRTIFETAPTWRGSPRATSLLCRSKPVGPLS